MLSILERYKWHQFSVVTSAIAGHDDFIQAVRERVITLQVCIQSYFINCPTRSLFVLCLGVPLTYLFNLKHLAQILSINKLYDLMNLNIQKYKA